MSESSLFWTTGSTGDGASPYPASQLFAWLRRTFLKAPTSESVLFGYANALAVTTTGTTKVTVGTGAAHCYEPTYENTAAVDVAIPTPSTSTRVDRIVLRASWTAQTVRITRIAGTEGAGAPALTQTPGTTYDVPLASVSITTGGAITVTDQRGYAHFNTRVAAANIDDLTITTAQIAANAVTTAKISDGNVTLSKLASGSVDATKILNYSIETDKIVDHAVTAAKLDTTNIATVSGGGVVMPSGGTIKGISVQTFTGAGTHAHGLGWTPNFVIPIIRGPTAYASVGVDNPPADGTNIYINSSVGGTPFIILMMLIG